jgi:S1-C subfamily serine protease
MNSSRVRLTVAGGACAALALFPAFSSAQSPAENGAGRNLTRQAQNEVAIALPSFAPLAEHVLPAVVNISVQLTEQAAAQDEGDTQGSGLVPSVPGGTPFDQFMRRFFENPRRNQQEKATALGSGFIIDPTGYVVTNNHVVGELKEHGHVTWGWLGVAIQSITPSIAKSLGLDPEHPTGALVVSVTPDSPAQKAGLKPGDVIIGAGGHKIETLHELPRLVAAASIGGRLDLTIRRAGKEQKLEATIAEMPETVASTGESAVPSSHANASALGMELLPLAPELRSELHVPKDLSGVVVGRIAPDSPARALGIQSGDVIVSIDQKPATNPEEAATELKEAAAQGDVLLLLDRHGVNEFVGLSVENNGIAGSSR